MINPMFRCLTFCFAAGQGRVAGEQFIFEFAQWGQADLARQFALNLPVGRQWVSDGQA